MLKSTINKEEMAKDVRLLRQPIFVLPPFARRWPYNINKAKAPEQEIPKEIFGKLPIASIACTCGGHKGNIHETGNICISCGSLLS